MPGGGGAITGGPGGGNVITPIVSEPVPCNPCVAAVFNCIKEFLPFPDWYKCLTGIGTNLSNAQNGKFDPLDYAGTVIDCTSAIAKSAELEAPELEILGNEVSVLKCAQEIEEGCKELLGGSSGEMDAMDAIASGLTAQDGSAVATGGLSGALDLLQKYIDDNQAFVDATTYLFGNSDWLNENTGPAFLSWVSA
jgi:hypothetical protein